MPLNSNFLYSLDITHKKIVNTYHLNSFVEFITWKLIPQRFLLFIHIFITILLSFLIYLNYPINLIIHVLLFTLFSSYCTCLCNNFDTSHLRIAFHEDNSKVFSFCHIYDSNCCKDLLHSVLCLHDRILLLFF